MKLLIKYLILLIRKTKICQIIQYHPVTWTYKISMNSIVVSNYSIKSRLLLLAMLMS